MPDRKAIEEGKYVFFILLLVAGALRFHHLGAIPYFNDELSALSRLDFSSLSELIEFGIKPDGHPALTQLFLYFWTNVFGTSETVVRFPFILAGMGALVLFYHVQLRTFGRTPANVFLAIMGAGQLFVFDSVMARPYAFGLLFTAMTAYGRSYFFAKEKAGIGSVILLGGSLALAAYTHYFAALTAGLIYLTGLFPLRPKSIKAYLSAGLLAVLLYLPHLSIFLTQISSGGIGGPEGWLDQPELMDFADFTLSAIGFNQVIFAALMAGLILGVFRSKSRSFYEFLLWPVLVFAIGWSYSTFRNPVMHEQTFVFVLPFVFMAATSITRERNRIISTSLPLIVAGILVWTLVYERNHYQTMEAQLFAWAGKMTKAYPEAVHNFSSNPDYIRFYNDAYEPDSAILSSLKNPAVSGYLSDGTDYVADILAEKRFPRIVEQKNGFTFLGMHLGKGVPNKGEYGSFLMDEEGSLRSEQEYLPLLDLNLSGDGLNFGHEIIAHVKIDSLPPEDLHLVFDLKKGDENIYWSAAKFSEIGVAWRNEFYLAHGLLLWNVFDSRKEMEGCVLKIYLWNPSKEVFYISYKEVYRRNENPNRYGLLSRRP